MSPTDLCPGCPWWCEFEAWCRENDAPQSDRIKKKLAVINEKLDIVRAENGIERINPA